MRRLVAAGIVALLGIVLAACGGGGGEQRFKVGLIIKQERNPFFRQIERTVQRAAARHGFDLDVAAGNSDVDNFRQVIAIGNMVRAGAKGILITPGESRRVVPAVRQARAQGVTVIALDTATEPASATDALFATDNRRAGELIGRYARAKAAELGLVPKVALLDLAPGITSGAQRHQGFLKGFGLTEDDARIAGAANTEGDRSKGRQAMARLLRANPDINVVYTVNEPAAFGAAAALRAAGKLPGNVVLVSVDGGCQAIRSGIRRGLIDGTAQQYPERMASEGMDALAAVARGRRAPSGYHDTGVQLITADPAPHVRSLGVAFGLRNCWG
jgi:fructose transport system substrate-binding protein